MYICRVQRFLIIQTAFLGDVILATPVIAELKRIYPDALIDVVVRKGNESLLSNNPKINQLFVWDKKKNKYKKLMALIRAVRKYKYKEVITLQRYANAGLITRFAKTESRIGFDKNTFSWMYNKIIPHSLLEGSHEVERNLRTISHHGAQQLIRPELFPSPDDFSIAKDHCSSSYYCLAPGSVWETKRLPVSKWKELIHHLLKKGEVLLIGGPDDIELCENIKSVFPEHVKNLAGKLSLLQSAALMKGALMNFVNDSGPLHIASAMNAPTRAFFCSTIPQFGFGPLADDSKVIETKKALDCRPCTFHGRKKCPLGHYECGYTIDVSPENLEI